MKRAKNDNLITYRKKQRLKNEELIKRAIEHIQKLNGDISFSLVSKVTHDIADRGKGEDGISLAGITKNPLYREMVESAKGSQAFKSNSVSGKIKNLPIGDMRMSLHGMRIELAKLKQENRVLSQMLATQRPQKEIAEGVELSVMEHAKELRKTGKNLIKRLLELELVYVDAQTNTLYVAMYDDVLMPKEAFELFM